MIFPASSQQPAASIAWPYDAIFAEWDKLAGGLKNRASYYPLYPSREDVEDGISHAAELLETKRPRFESMAQAYIWLFRDVEHYLQHCHRFATHLEDLDAVSGYAMEDTAIRAFETKDRLDHTLEQLNEEDRELLYLNHVSGLTLKEIAEMRGVSLDSVQSRHSRAMKQLRKIKYFRKV